MSDEIFLGLDLATAGARLHAVTSHGKVLTERSLPLPPTQAPAPGHVEQLPTYLEVARDVIRHVSADLGRRVGAVRALSITGTSGTVVPCAPDGRPTSSAILYNDQRAWAQAEHLSDAGFPSTATSSLARIGWLEANAPASLYLHTPDVVATGLIGRVPPTDTSHALKAGIDPVAAVWDTQRLDALGILPRTLPDLVHPGTELGVVCGDAAAETGLPAGVTVIAGMTDGCTAQIGAGAVHIGDTVGMLGTTLVLKAVSVEAVTSYDGAVYSHYAPDGSYWPGGASNVGADVIRSEFGNRDLTELEALAERHGVASAVRYPLSTVGERFPFNRPKAEGFILGETTTPGAAYRAFLEGVAFAERLGLEALRALGVKVVSHRVAGGGSQSRLWNRIRATVLDRPVTRPANASSGYGAAVLALASYTRSSLIDVVATTEQTAEVIDPDASQTERLQQNFERLCEELSRRGYLTAYQKQI